MGRRGELGQFPNWVSTLEELTIGRIALLNWPLPILFQTWHSRVSWILPDSHLSYVAICQASTGRRGTTQTFWLWQTPSVGCTVPGTRSVPRKGSTEPCPGRAIGTELPGPRPLCSWLGYLGHRAEGYLCSEYKFRWKVFHSFFFFFPQSKASPRSEGPVVQRLYWASIRAGWALYADFPQNPPPRKARVVRLLPRFCRVSGSHRCNAMGQDILDKNQPRT